MIINPNNFNNLEQIIKNSKRWRKVKLIGYDPKTLAELIHRVVILKQETVYYNTRTKLKTVTQCNVNRARSINDVYKIAKTYKPDITINQIINAFKRLYNETLGYNYCNTVRKYVHHLKNYRYGNLESIKNALGDLNISLCTKQ